MSRATALTLPASPWIAWQPAAWKRSWSTSTTTASPPASARYECLQRLDPQIKQDRPARSRTTCRHLGEKPGRAEICACRATYGACPRPVLAFSQRLQLLQTDAASRNRTVGGQRRPAPRPQSAGAPGHFLQERQVQRHGRKVGCSSAYPAPNARRVLVRPLINEPEIHRRLEFLADRTLKVAREICL